MDAPPRYDKKLDMARKDYDKVYFMLSTTSLCMLLVNIYYFSFPVFYSLGVSHDIAVSFFHRLSADGWFASRAKLKLISAGLLVMSMAVRTGRGTDKGWPVISSLSAVGITAMFLPVESPVWYIVTSLVGYTLSAWGFSQAGRKISGFRKADNDILETFVQCDRLIRTADSINIPTLYQHNKRIRHGWINVVSPARATLVLGTPGSGKSYSVYGPFIEQMIEKHYTMFVYDYKYPSLTEKVYNEMLANYGSYPVLPEFVVINFKDPRYSNRCNPIHPRYITDPADTTEIADLVMLNVNKAAVEKEDFFSMSAKVYLDALIWFLRIYEDGRYCTFPHVIELMGQDYQKVFRILSAEPQLEVKIKPFVNALEGGAQEQLQGQIASAQIPMNKFVSPSLYWVLSGDDFSLDINNPESPKILCVGNDPDRQNIYGTSLALLTSRMFKLINHKGKQRFGVLLDELPTIFLKGLDNLIATARENGVAIVLGAQDKTQLIRDYTEKEANVIFNTVGNIFSGQVNGRTAEELSRSFGKEFREQQSQTRSVDSESLNISYGLFDIMPVSKIETLSQGYFFGKVADSFSAPIERKFFCGQIVIDEKRQKEKRKHWKPLPLMTDFGTRTVDGLDDGERSRIILEHCEKSLGSGHLLGKDKEAAARQMASSMSAKDRQKILETYIEDESKRIVNDVIEANFRKIRRDIAELVEKRIRELDWLEG